MPPAAGAAPARSPRGRAPAALTKPREKVSPYDFKRPERVGKEQMRALANAARGLWPKFRRRALGAAAQHRRSQADQRRSVDLQRVRVQPGESDLLQPAAGRAAGRQPDSRHQPVDRLSDHRPAVGRRPRKRTVGPAAADRDRAAAGLADHDAVSARAETRLVERVGPRAFGRAASKAIRNWCRSCRRTKWSC